MFTKGDRVMILNPPIHKVKPGSVGKIQSTDYKSPITHRDYSYVKVMKNGYIFAVYDEDLILI